MAAESFVEKNRVSHNVAVVIVGDAATSAEKRQRERPSFLPSFLPSFFPFFLHHRADRDKVGSSATPLTQAHAVMEKARGRGGRPGTRTARRAQTKSGLGGDTLSRKKGGRKAGAKQVAAKAGRPGASRQKAESCAQQAESRKAAAATVYALFGEKANANEDRSCRGGVRCPARLLCGTSGRRDATCLDKTRRDSRN